MHCSRYISSSGGEEKETILDGEIRQLCDFSVSQEKEAVFEPTAYIVFPDDKLACGLLPLSWFERVQSPNDTKQKVEKTLNNVRTTKQEQTNNSFRSTKKQSLSFVSRGN